MIDLNELFYGNVAIYYLIFTIVLFAITIVITRSLQIKNIMAINVIFGIISLYLYACGVLEFIYACVGLILSIISIYLELRHKNG